MTRRYGWHPSIPDIRDLRYMEANRIPVLPQTVDLRVACPPVYDQGSLGSCTANAIAAALEFDMLKQSEAAFIPSRLFIYYNERAKEGTIVSDAGASLRDGIKSVNRQGACSEDAWPYDIAEFATQPPVQCYQDARLHRSLNYMRIGQSITAMKVCLASGYPFVFGFTAYESLESEQVAKTGIVPMPGPDEAPLGGHAVLACGYRESEQMFICRNSWGPVWGQEGYFLMPYNYLLNPNLSSDFWTIRTIS